MQTIAKHFPIIFTQNWGKIDKGYQIPKIQNFFIQTLSKIERKKTNLILKILEDWLKNYQMLSTADSNEEKVLQSEIREIDSKDAQILAQ